MSAYNTMIKINHDIIKGVVLTEPQKSSVVVELLSECTSNTTSIGLKQNLNTNGRCMYPIFYVPPADIKIKTVINQTPKTRIFSANMYELEILRLLHMLIPDNTQVQHMLQETLERLKTTCFGYQEDGVGECFDTSLVVLRFLNTVASRETDWIQSRIDNYNNHVKDKKRSWHCYYYYWLCLSEMPSEMAKCELDQYKAEIIECLMNKSYGMNREQDRIFNPVVISILRNALSKYPEYGYIKNGSPYVNDKDGRLYFDISREGA